MIYVALLRGINVGGNNQVEMKNSKPHLSQSGSGMLLPISIQAISFLKRSCITGMSLLRRLKKL